MDKIPFLIILGLIGGVVGGFFGLGAGTILIPSLVFFLGFSQHLAQGTSMATLLPPVTILAVIEYYRNGHVDVKASLYIALGFIFGSLLGAYLANFFSSQVLKKCFGVYLFIISLKFIFY